MNQQDIHLSSKFLVFGQELSLPPKYMYPNPQENETTDNHEFVHSKRQAFHLSYFDAI